jgi:hypothetical protein
VAALIRSKKRGLAEPGVAGVQVGNPAAVVPWALAPRFGQHLLKSDFHAALAAHSAFLLFSALVSSSGLYLAVSEGHSLFPQRCKPLSSLQSALVVRAQVMG